MLNKKARLNIIERDKKKKYVNMTLFKICYDKKISLIEILHFHNKILDDFVQ